MRPDAELFVSTNKERNGVGKSQVDIEDFLMARYKASNKYRKKISVYVCTFPLWKMRWQH